MRTKRLQPVGLAAAEQGRAEAAVGGLGGGADQLQQTRLHVGEQGVLLSLAVAVDLVDEKQGGLAALAGPIGYGAQFFDAGIYGRQGFQKSHFQLLGDQMGQAGFATPRRSPKDQAGGQSTGLEQAPQRLTGG